MCGSKSFFYSFCAARIKGCSTVNKAGCLATALFATCVVAGGLQEEPRIVDPGTKTAAGLMFTFSLWASLQELK